jgi:transposase
VGYCCSVSSQAGRGPERKDDRKVLNGIFYILRTSAPWRDLPQRYGPRATVYNRHVRWGERGVWQGVFESLAQECEDALVFIDASIVKAHRAAAGSKKGNWKKVLAVHEVVAQARFTQPWTPQDAR